MTAPVSMAELLLSEPNCRICTSRNLVVYVWSDVPTPAQLRECGRISRAMARAYPAGTGLLDIIVDGTPNFSQEMRDETTRLTHDPGYSRLGVADVVLITGLTGATVRAFLGTLALLSHRRHRPHKVLGDVPSASDWLAPKLGAGGGEWKPADLVAVATEVMGR